MNLTKSLVLGMVVCLGMFGTVAFAQQTGTIAGGITDNAGTPLPGVVIEAQGDILPRPRTAVSNALGTYRFPLLPPGNYELTYTFTGMGTVKRKARVLLQQLTIVDVTMTPETQEALTVTAQLPLIDTTSTELKGAIDKDVVEGLPVGQEYRDLVKLVPGVQYTEDSIRGPSAGGSGQDNTYLFDGVNVTLPLFGTLATDPASHDVEQVSILKGGAKALDFNRSGGFTINTISKSGTNNYQGEVSYQIQPADLTSPDDDSDGFISDQDKTWLTANFGGPLLKERLFFYASYFGPTVDRNNQANFYGDVPDFKSTRDEIFGKLTFSPTANFTLSASYRDSSRENTASGVTGSATAGTATTGETQDLAIGILEGSWIINSNSSLSFKYTDFKTEGTGRPDNLLGFFASNTGGSLDVNNLDSQGLFIVPSLNGDPVFDAGAQTLIDQYGYLDGGTRVGGGLVGVDDFINRQDFFREGWQISYDLAFTTGSMIHDFHVGFQAHEDKEEVQRSSNGWGVISYLGGIDADHPERFYSARFLQGSLQAALGNGVSVVESRFESENIEINDSITWEDWTFNLGVMLSHDTYIGQGLENDSSAVSGFRVNPDSFYTMYEMDWEDMISPRMGITWNIHETDAIYVSWSRYLPAATSLPRAASWARNLIGRRIEVFFDENGNFLEATNVRSSSGKFFQPNMDPRTTEEYLAGYSWVINDNWTAKTHFRHRYAHNFWEDTNNNARARFGNTDEIRSQPDYIPELADYRSEIGGSSYVIAQLDGAVSKYYELSADAEYRDEDYYFKTAYVWSHYYGNIDQDNTTVSNDQNIFIGSSNLADGPGRQLWDLKYGNLRGDRRHQLKAYGFRKIHPWNASVGLFFLWQSGQLWESWNYSFYGDLVGSSTSDTIRFSEPAGSRRTSDHSQIDFNYTQNFLLGERYRMQLRFDLFNVMDNQSPYNIQPRVNSAGYALPRDFYDPRRLQIKLALKF